VLSIVEQLVSIPSPSGGEHGVADLTERLLRDMGVANVRRLAVDDAANMVVGRIEGQRKGPGLLLAFHLDVGDPDPEWKDPLPPRREGNRLYGVGAYDMKGGAACILAAFEAFVAQGHTLNGPLVIAGTTDEMRWSRGAHALIRSGMLEGCTAAAIGEWTEWATFQPGARGRHLVHLTSSNVPVERIVAALDGVSTKTPPREGVSEEIRIRKDGDASVLVNAFVPPPAGPDDVVRAVRGALAAHGLADDIRLELDPRPTPGPKSYRVDDKAPIVRAMRTAIREELRTEALTDLAHNVSDANHLVWTGGLDTIIYGPTGGYTEGGAEYLDIKSLVPVSRVYLHLN
jgi:acetylornithine deacetylase/succinyl-diaminopimelate desuccinylase-like protein